MMTGNQTSKNKTINIKCPIHEKQDISILNFENEDDTKRLMCSICIQSLKTKNNIIQIDDIFNDKQCFDKVLHLNRGLLQKGLNISNPINLNALKCNIQQEFSDLRKNVNKKIDEIEQNHILQIESIINEGHELKNIVDQVNSIKLIEQALNDGENNIDILEQKLNKAILNIHSSKIKAYCNIQQTIIEIEAKLKKLQKCIPSESSNLIQSLIQTLYGFEKSKSPLQEVIKQHITNKQFQQIIQINGEQFRMNPLILYFSKNENIQNTYICQTSNSIDIECMSNERVQMYFSQDIKNTKEYQFFFKIIDQPNNNFKIGLIDEDSLGSMSLCSEQKQGPFCKIFGNNNLNKGCCQIQKGKNLAIGSQEKIVQGRFNISKNELSFSDWPNQNNINILSDNCKFDINKSYKLCIQFNLDNDYQKIKFMKYLLEYPN